MGKLWINMSCALLCCWGLSGYAQGADAPGIGARYTQPISAKQKRHLLKLRKTICLKLAECAPDQMTAKECRKAPDNDPFIYSLPRGARAASAQALKHCARGVKASSCEEFYSEIPPEGCEFFR